MTENSNAGIDYSTWLSRPLEHRVDMLQYEYVRDGDMRSVELANQIFRRPDHGRMSNDPLRNMIYHFICAATMVTRYAIDGGLDQETAHNLSDVMIQRVDHAQSIDDVLDLVTELYTSFTERVAQAKEKNAGSLPIRQAKQYIYSHLHERINISQLSEYVGLSQNYLSYLFRKEMNQTIADFIRSKRLETAARLLSQSDRSISDIASTLAFASDSHFIQAFRKYYGVTPAVYRRDRNEIIQE